MPHDHGVLIHELGYRHPGQAATEAPALADVSFAVPPGSLCCLAGANGSGKSTLLRILAGLLKPATGRAMVGGRRIPGQDAAARRMAALVMQESELQVIGATVREDLLLGFAPDDTEAEAKAWTLAGRLGLQPRWERPVTALSFGEKRKLCLAAQMLAEPAILLFDEPFSGLDYPAMQEMRAILLANAAAGYTQLVATHDLEPVADIADALAVLHHGRLVGHGPVATQLHGLQRYGVRPPCAWLNGQGLVPWS